MSANVVTQLQVKSHNSPDEKRRPTRARSISCPLATTPRPVQFEPGLALVRMHQARVHTDSCQNSHVGFCVSGKLTVETTDGGRIDHRRRRFLHHSAGPRRLGGRRGPVCRVEFLSAASFAKARNSGSARKKRGAATARVS